MSETVRLAAVQASSVWLDRDRTIAKACALIDEAGAEDADLIGFPENYVPGHPSWLHYVPPADPTSLRSMTRLFNQAVEILGPAVDALREAAARNTIVVVMGLTERVPGSTGTLYNTQLVIDATGEIVGRHQKLVATMTERLVHSPGRPETQRTFETTLGEVSGLICGENSNPLALAMIASKYPVVHVASWPAHVSPSSHSGVRKISRMVTQSVGHMLGTFVVSPAGANSEDMIADIARTPADEKFLRDPAKSGGAMIVGPFGQILAGPLPGGQEGIIYADADFEACIQARMVVDFAGHYNRSDVYRLTVDNAPRELVTDQLAERSGSTKSKVQ